MKVKRRTKRILQAQVELLSIDLMIYARMRSELSRRRRKKKTVNFWMRDYVAARPFLGAYENLVRELQRPHNSARFQNFLRVDNDLFQQLLAEVGPVLKKDFVVRMPLDPGLKLAVTLRYLATGNTYTDLHYQFRVGICSIARFVPEVCEAIIDVLTDRVMPPIDVDSLKKTAQEFQQRWNLPHCVGALDGRHCRIIKPPGTGTLYYNYKNFFSVVLFGLADANMRFLWCNVGANGSASDGQIFQGSSLGGALEDGDFPMPAAERMPGCPDTAPALPYFIVGDDAFPLRTWMQKPYPRSQESRLSIPERVYNYRISRARRIVESAFGILATRFHCLWRTMLQRKKAPKESIVLCCVMLHNLLRTQHPSSGPQPDAEGRLDETTFNLHECAEYGEEGRPGHNYPRDAKELRRHLVDYFTHEGRVPFQESRINT